mmetsp:Transcript_32102/g.55388  ORF Transcript_32102/g.55388 Transcript_32102/m.55388 type:complete len:302 (+) Transcript_32102:473-1378(+)
MLHRHNSSSKATTPPPDNHSSEHFWNNHLYKEYASTVLAGVIRAFVGVPVEHPFEYIKTIQQATNSRSALKVVRSEVGTHGVMKLYGGFMPNLINTSIKQMYRFPAMRFLPNTYTKWFSEVNAYAMTGLTIGVMETLIVCPLERLKVWKMTVPPGTRIRDFFATGLNLRLLYRGIEPTMLRQSMNWTTMLTTDYFLRRQVIKYNEGTPITSLQSLMLGLCVGFSMTITVLPFDYLKTRAQDFSNKEPVSFYAMTKNVLASEHTMRGKVGMFYAGWAPRSIQFTINAVLTLGILNYLKRRPF